MNRITFDQLAAEPDDRIDVATGAALIAKDVYDDLDIDALLSRLDDLAGPLRGGALAGMPLAAQAEVLRERFEELGFRGNTSDYYDAKNSLLPDVLERRTGIPISMTFVWCEIARRAGVFARGIAFPGHFLGRIDELPALSGRTAASPVIVDPFNGAKTLSDAGILAWVRRAQGPRAELTPALLEPATARVTHVSLFDGSLISGGNARRNIAALISLALRLHVIANLLFETIHLRVTKTRRADRLVHALMDDEFEGFGDAAGFGGIGHAHLSRVNGISEIRPAHRRFAHVQIAQPIDVVADAKRADDIAKKIRRSPDFA